ncbi:MAG: hypothetical protein ACPIOQ_20725 [Promethearchaeia archaeon]
MLHFLTCDRCDREISVGRIDDAVNLPDCIVLHVFRQLRAGRATNLKMGHKFEADRKMRVAVVGGGPAGACAAEIFAQVCSILLLSWRALTSSLPLYT